MQCPVSNNSVCWCSTPAHVIATTCPALQPPPAHIPGMAPRLQFVTPATGFQQSHMPYPPTPPQPQYQQAPATGYPPQQPIEYMMQGANTVAIGTWPTYPMPMSYHRPPPPPPPARPHPSTLPRHSVDYPPSVQPRQPRHSLPAQPTIIFPPFGATTTGPAVNPTHTGVPVLPGAQHCTSVANIQHVTTVTQQKQFNEGAIGTWSRTPPSTYPMPIGHNGAAPPTPPARPHPSTLQRYSVDYPPSVQPQQHRHSLQHQSTFPTLGVPMTNRTTYPTHAGVPTLPVAQNYTSVTHVQQLTTLRQQQQPATPSSDPVVPQGYNIVVSPCTQICCCIHELFRTFLITFHITISCYSYEDVYLKFALNTHMQDVFQDGNIIQLIPRGGSAPIKLSGSLIKPHGDFLHPESMSTQSQSRMCLYHNEIHLQLIHKLCMCAKAQT